MSLKGKFIYVFLCIVLAIVFINTKSVVPMILAILLMCICLKHSGSKLFLILLISFSFFLFYKAEKYDKDLSNIYVEEEYVVKEVKESYLIVKAKEKYIVYLDDTSIYKPGNVVKIKGVYKIIEKDLDIDIFEFSKYLGHKRIYYKIDINEISIIDFKQSISSSIVHFLTNKLENESYDMTKMLLFNDKYSNIDNYTNLIEINAVHLFVVSGFHISFIFSLIQLFFKKHKKFGVIFSAFLTGLYVYILNFAIGALRAYLTKILLIIFKKKINSLDAVSISGIIILLIEPQNVFMYSFIMSYLITFVIVLSNKLLSKYNKFLQTLLISLICFLTMIPLQLQLNNTLNFISIFSNVFFGYAVIGIFLLCIIGLPLSLINGNIFGVIYKFFNQIVSWLSSLNLSILFGVMLPVFVVFYYVCLLLGLYNFEKGKTKKSCLNFLIIISILLGLYNRQYFQIYQKVTFLNVYQGDCCIIQDSFSGQTLLIDTGGLSNYDIATNKIIPYLKYHGIRKINKVIITHDDYDHGGALTSLKNQIHIDEILTDNISTVEIGKIVLKNLNIYNDEFCEENDKSIVLYGKICGYNFLFTGDISTAVEKRIIQDNPLLDVDVLKVSHHGSKTATSKEFVNAIKPEYAIISVGKNFYGHPSEEVIENLNSNNVIIYRTDLNGTIRFKGKIFDFCFIETAK